MGEFVSRNWLKRKAISTEILSETGGNSSEVASNTEDKISLFYVQKLLFLETLSVFPFQRDQIHNLLLSLFCLNCIKIKLYNALLLQSTNSEIPGETKGCL
jgi:hypothetical protein